MEARPEDLVKKIAERVDECGGTAYYVGGFVRDKYLGRENKDVDIEVHGVPQEMLMEILEGLAPTDTYGASFGIYSIRGSGIDVALPRREKLLTDDASCTDSAKAGGSGAEVPARSPGDNRRNSHRAFDVEADPFIGTLNASRRRDFTINSMMLSVLDGRLVDHFGGLEDLQAGIIRHVDNKSFPEDPLRVLRGAQFAARFRFRIAEDTVKLCRDIDLRNLSRERVEDEMKKALLKADKPSIFFECLKEMNQLKVWFPEVEMLIGIQQDPVYHPEGDVWVHTMEVIDRAASLRDKVQNPYAFMLLALTHDFGKIAATEFVKGRWHAYRHETEGLPIIDNFINRLVGNRSIRHYVRNMVPLHMKPNIALCSQPSVKSTNRMFDQAAVPEELIYFSEADRPEVVGDEVFNCDSSFLWERYDIYREIMEKPYVMGRDLIEAGCSPGESFKLALEHAHKLRLAGVEKECALRQVLGYMRKIERKK